MYSKAKDTLADISDMTDGAAKLYKKAKCRSPRMRKEITVRSKYYSSHSEKHPIAESLMQFEVDCNLLKLALIAVGVTVLMWVYCSSRKKSPRQ